MRFLYHGANDSRQGPSIKPSPGSIKPETNWRAQTGSAERWKRLVAIPLALAEIPTLIKQAPLDAKTKQELSTLASKFVADINAAENNELKLAFEQLKEIKHELSLVLFRVIVRGKIVSNKIKPGLPEDEIRKWNHYSYEKDIHRELGQIAVETNTADLASQCTTHIREFGVEASKPLISLLASNNEWPALAWMGGYGGIDQAALANSLSPFLESIEKFSYKREPNELLCIIAAHCSDEGKRNRALERISGVNRSDAPIHSVASVAFSSPYGGTALKAIDKLLQLDPQAHMGLGFRNIFNSKIPEVRAYAFKEFKARYVFGQRCEYLHICTWIPAARYIPNNYISDDIHALMLEHLENGFITSGSSKWPKELLTWLSYYSGKCGMQAYALREKAEAHIAENQQRCYGTEERAKIALNIYELMRLSEQATDTNVRSKAMNDFLALFEQATGEGLKHEAKELYNTLVASKAAEERRKNGA